jgi:hypothetical protein
MKDEQFFSSFGNNKSKICVDCRTYKQDYAKKNRQHLLEMRRMKYHLNSESKRKKESEYRFEILKNPNRKRKLFSNHLKRKYGLDVDAYEKMIAEQDNKCAICKAEFAEAMKSWNKPCVDHCHSTKKVRGILCRRCNLTLFYLEGYKHFDEAREYLRVNDVTDKEPLR